jgi:hypothetical protein
MVRNNKELIENRVSESVNDFSIPLAVNACLRALPLMGKFDVVPVVSNNEYIVRVMRAFITIRSNNRKTEKDLLVAAKDSVESFGAETSVFDLITRSCISCLKMFYSSSRIDRLSLLKNVINSSGDAYKNYSLRNYGSSSIIDIRQASLNDLDRIESGGRNIIFPEKYQNELIWLSFERWILARDDSWKFWVVWLRGALLGLVDYDIPLSVWPIVERHMTLMSNEFWGQNIKEVNSYFGNLILKTADDIIEHESLASQSTAGLQFIEKGDILSSEEMSKVDKILSESLKPELINRTKLLIDSCKDNTDKRVMQKAELFLPSILSILDNPRLYVLRGSALRVEKRLQENIIDDFDTPPLSPAAGSALIDVVDVHNLIVRSDNVLRDIDALLSDPNFPSNAEGVRGLKSLLVETNNKIAFDNDTKEKLQSIILLEQSEDIEANIIAIQTIINMSKTIYRSLGGVKGIAATALSIPAFVYLIGGWMVRNEAVILTYVEKGSAIASMIHRLIETLKGLPIY